jgi:hypothetical protein
VEPSLPTSSNESVSYCESYSNNLSLSHPINTCIGYGQCAARLPGCNKNAAAGGTSLVHVASSYPMSKEDADICAPDKRETPCKTRG